MPSYDVIQIKNAYRSRLAEVISKHGIGLRPSGQWLIGRCPFHEDDRPSLGVQVAKDYWRCFACGKKGDVVSFIQERCGLSFVDALEYLARGSGVAPTEDRFQRGTTYLPPTNAVRRPQGVQAFWKRCLAVTRDRSLIEWLESRGLDPRLIARLDLARRVPEGPLPAWIPKEWVQRRGYRLVVPVWDGNGQLVTVRLRSTYRKADPKTRAVLGATQGRGVMADRLGAWMLEGDARARAVVERVGIYVAEGEPDFLTLSSLTPHCAWRARSTGDRHPAVLGLFQSAWCEEIAARIPPATVTIWPHMDPPGPGGMGPGHKYAYHVRASLLDVGFPPSLIRWVTLRTATDVNELHLMARERRRAPWVRSEVMPELPRAA